MSQRVVIPALSTTFTAVCERCAEFDAHDGWTGSTFAGRLDPDLNEGVFLCRRGHHVRVVRMPPQEQSELAEAS